MTTAAPVPPAASPCATTTPGCVKIQGFAAFHPAAAAPRDPIPLIEEPTMSDQTSSPAQDENHLIAERRQKLADWRATGKAFPGRSRPICAWPQQTRYKGTGSIEDAANFTCGYPHACATSARSRECETVSCPPVESCTSLSKSTWIIFLGRS